MRYGAATAAAVLVAAERSIDRRESGIGPCTGPPGVPEVSRRHVKRSTAHLILTDSLPARRGGACYQYAGRANCLSTATKTKGMVMRPARTCWLLLSALLIGCSSG